MGQSPHIYLNAPVEGLAVSEGLADSDPRLFWKGCGRMGGDPNRAVYGYIRSIVPNLPTGGGPALGGGLLGTDLLAVPACGPDWVGSNNLALDRNFVFFIDQRRRLMRLSRTPAAGEMPVRLADAEPANRNGYVLAASPGWIAWSNGANVFRVRTDGVPGLSGGGAILDDGVLTNISDLQAWGDGYVVRDGSLLYRIAPLAPASRYFRAVPLRATQDVTAFTVHAGRLYVAIASTDIRGNLIAQIAPDGGIRERRWVAYHSAGEWIGQLAVSGETAYFHVVQPSHVNDGPIVRLALSEGATREILAQRIRMSTESRLAVSGGYLLWTNFADARLNRLPADMVIPTP